jgi:asparagine synthase (glutamine-hydrolysing)
MCGICGIYNFGTEAPVLRQDIQDMTKTLIHRGPDDEGYYVHRSIGLGFRRLSIIDLAGGHQPMSDQEQSVWIVFNGEIYNYRELRAELESFGHVFRTESDTEVIIHGYKQWGDEVLNFLNGMFGLAIWDVREKRLIIARDPFGIKLVYYKIENGCASFGSEIRPLLALNKRSTDVDPVAMNLFLRYRYTPSPFTLHKEIKKLAPGTMLIFESGGYKIRRWYLNRPKQFCPPKTEEAACEELTALYQKSVKRHLISDVPVGLLLSGGIDSGLLLALMNQFGSAWPTFTVGYGVDFSDDELMDAAETASSFSSRHTSVSLTRASFEEALPKIVASLEEPIAASSIVPMYFVCERARQNVKVALIGQGPDELFGGYRRHLGVRYGAAWGRLPRCIRSSITSAIRMLPRNETLKRGLYSLDVLDRVHRYQQVLSILPGARVDALFQEGIAGKNPGDKILECWGGFDEMMQGLDELGGFQFIELRSTLPDELLMYADKLSMAHGLELRVPYLDKEVVEFVERLPQKFKVKGLWQKWLHRKVCASFLPSSFLRRAKRGFAVNVVDNWFRADKGSMMRELLLDKGSCMYRYLRHKAVQELYDEHANGRCDNHKILFSLVVLEEWLRSPASGHA